MMKRREMLREAAGLAVAACLIMMLSASLKAQNAPSVQGNVTDEQGGNVVGADVRLSSREGIQFQTTTNAEGVFGFNNVPEGSYLIEVKARGFSLFTTEEIRLHRGENKSVRLQLSVAAINARVVVTATGTPQRADEVAKVLTAIGAEQIELKQELTLAEAARGVPGVRVQQQGSPGALTTLRLRGLRNFDTALLLDGLRVRDAADINGSAASLIADLVPVSIDRLEILRGSGSSIYGTNAIGGVVNIVPAVGSGGWRFEAGAEASGLSTFREVVRMAGGANPFGFALGINRIDVRKGVDGNDEYGNTAFAGRFEYNPSPSIVVSGNLYGTIANARLNDSPVALPPAFGSTESFPKAVAGVNYQPDFNNPDQGRRHRLLVGSVRLTQQLNDWLTYSVAYQRASSSRRNYNGPLIDPEFASFYPFGDFEFLSVNRGTTDTFDGRLHLRLGRANLATAGFEFETESIFQESFPSFTVSNGTTDKQRTFALFGQDQISLLDDRLQMSIGVRTQSYRLRVADRPGFLQSVDTRRSVTGDGAIAYLMRSTKTKFRAHVGNGFRAPALFERFGEGSFPGIGLTRFGDPTLRAEQSISVDGGIDQRFARDRVVLSATFFYTRLQRVIAFQSFTVDPLGLGRFSGYANRSGGISRGLEVFIETTPARGTEIRGSYSFTNSDRATLGQGLQPEYVIPQHALSLTLTQRYRSLAVNLDLNRTGAHLAPVFESNFPFRMAELTFSGYTKGDLFATYQRRLSESVTALLFGGADNIFNRKYFENGFRAPGIVGRGGVRFTF